MTRQQFIDEITSWSDLIDWCVNNGCSYCDDIYTDNDRDEIINNELVDMAENENWRELKETLISLDETSAYYWKRDGWGEWYDVDNDFDDYFSDVLDWADDNNMFESDDEEPIPEETMSGEALVEQSDEFVADTGISLDDFFASSVESLDVIASETATIAAEANSEFDKFTQRLTTVGVC